MEVCVQLHKSPFTWICHELHTCSLPALQLRPGGKASMKMVHMVPFQEALPSWTIVGWYVLGGGLATLNRP